MALTLTVTVTVVVTMTVTMTVTVTVTSTRLLDLKTPTPRTSPPRHAPGSELPLPPSVCGNFCVVGTNSGAIYKYNIQSGQPRGSFPKTAARKKRALPGNNKAGAGSVKVTAKKLKKSFTGSGSLRNAAGKLLKHVRRDDVPPSDAATGEGGEGDDGEAMDEEAAAAMAAAAVAEAAAAAKALAGHGQTVTGVQIDALNRHLISASLDGTF